MYPSLLLSAPQGCSGKTTVSIGICAALKHRGLVVQPFKKGPDYIDASWMKIAAGRSCRNLDLFLIPEDELRTSFQRACQGADLAFIEGAMGLYDGLGSSGWGSTAHLARLLEVPVILTINTARMTSSIAAMVNGYRNFQPETNIAGVILNNVSGSRHEQKLRTAVEEFCGIPVLGSVHRDANLSITQRHLGIIPYGECENSEVIDQVRRHVEDGVDMEALLDIARGVPNDSTKDIEAPAKQKAIVRIGVMRDRVFTFYYPENLEALARAGAELVFIDSLHEKQLPEIDALYIGGGFPELFLKELEANRTLRQNIAEAIEDRLPVYAECAGLMYLCQGIHYKEQRHEMVGTFPSDVEIFEKPQGHGYVEAEVTNKNPLFPVGLELHGHEFHYSRLTQSDGLKFAYGLKRGRGTNGEADAIIYKNVFAAYTHLHASGAPQWAEAFVSLALRERQRQLAFT